MRFTIRDLLWLTVVVAMGVAWWMDRSRLIAQIADLSEINTVPFDPVSKLPNPSARSQNLPSN